MYIFVKILKKPATATEDLVQQACLAKVSVQRSELKIHEVKSAMPSAKTITETLQPTVQYPTGNL